MLTWAIIFAVVALIAGALGFTGIAAGAANIARILFFIFLAIVVILLILGYTDRPGPNASLDFDGMLTVARAFAGPALVARVPPT